MAQVFIVSSSDVTWIFEKFNQKCSKKKTDVVVEIGFESVRLAGACVPEHSIR